jgi:ribose transport system permease protein
MSEAGPGAGSSPRSKTTREGVPGAGPAAATPDGTPGAPVATVSTTQRGRREHILSMLSFRNISAIYIFIGLFVLFSLWVPTTFLNGDTWKSLVDASSLNALVAVGLILPLSAGAFNLAIGTEVGMGAILIAWLIELRHISTVPSIALTLIAGVAIGMTSGLLITRGRIDSFIATLGISSVLTALTEWVSGSEQILNLPLSFQGLATNTLLGLTYPVWFMLVMAVVVWYVLERTPAGRRVYATGGNVDAARLAGVNTSLVIVGCLMACGLIAACAGVLATSQLDVGDPTIGPAYLLPAYAAAFLGSTQFRGGRYNVWGTVVAVYVLAVGVKGLQLAGAPTWIPDLFNGVALIIAVGLAKFQGDAARTSAISRMLRRRPRVTPASPAAAAGSGAGSGVVAPGLSLGERVRPFLSEVHAATGETVDLSVLDGDGARFIDQIVAPQRLRAVSAVGTTFPLHCVAGGKALLAALDPAEVDRLLPETLARFTASTITSRSALQTELERVRAEGVAFDHEEHTTGICGVAVAIRDGTGPVAAIAVPMPSQRFGSSEEEVVRVLRDIAERCSRELADGAAPVESGV